MVARWGLFAATREWVQVPCTACGPLASLGPGIGLGPFGQWFTRKETWAEQAGAWVTYLARSSYMLQQGRFAADVAYLYGEDEKVTALFERRAPAIPAGYAWDLVNADALRNR